MAAYNCGATLDRALESVERQTLGSWELIVIDDGSGDDTPAILDRHAQADPRIRAIHQENAGVAVARRRGVELARGSM